MSAMDIYEILKYLPHRYPFLLVDRVLKCEPGKSIIAIKNVTMNEPFFIGHFPGKPIMPGVLILEALAQTSGILANKTTETTSEGYLYLFAGVDNTRFKRVVEPGDQLRLEVEFVRAKQDVWKFNGTAYVGEQVVCTTEMTSARRKIES